MKAPAPLKPYARTLRFAWKSAKSMFGNYPRECSLCGHSGRFFAYGYPLVADILCPKCLSLERHRLLALYDRQHSIFSGKKILHFAPEKSLSRYIKSRSPISYQSCDLFDRSADLCINIESINLPDDSFNLIICSHVLEHVNDKRALPELYRVTEPGGIVLAMFPIVEGWSTTFEDATKTSESERLLFFGQHDHVRYYGSDARIRLRDAGFEVEEWTAKEPDVSKYGLMRGEKIFICRKR